MFEAGTLLRRKERYNELDEPIFIWEVLRVNDKVFFVINSESGFSKKDIIHKFPNQRILLPNHAKFKLIEQKAIESSYVLFTKSPYGDISDSIKWAKDRENMAPELFINGAYCWMLFFHITRFTDSEYCKSAEDKIYKNKHTLIKPIESLEDLDEKQNQHLNNIGYVVTFDLIPKRFVLIKMIAMAKEIIKEIFPPGDDAFANSIIEKLLLGMSLSYYKSNQDKIKSVTMNYGQKFPGDFQVFKQFTSMLNKFDEEIKMYEGINEEQIKIELNAASNGVRLPKRDDGKGMLMKLLEFDMAFWQRLILLDIDKDVPVRKRYKDSFSVSYNYMLLLPFFQWLAPHLFPQYVDKKVNAETYNKVVVERMKNFVEGKIF